jgi:hypothetical protein
MLNSLTRSQARLATALIFLFSFAALLLLMDLRVGVYDEGILLTGGALVAEGAVPHRDFYANYGPAQFYILAALFDMGGPSFMAARVYDVLVRAAIVAVSFGLLAGRVSLLHALVGAGLCGLWLLSAGFYLYPTFPSLLLALVGTWLLVRPSGAPQSGALVAAGAATGVVALFRYDVGFYVLAAHAVALAYLAASGEGRRGQKAARWFGWMLRYGLGTAATFLIPAALLLIAGAGPGFLHDTFDYPLRFYARMRSLPLPGPADLLRAPGDAAAYLPFIAPVLAAAVLLWPRGSNLEKSDDARDRLFAVAMAALTLFLSIKGVVRFHVVHMMIAIIPATLLVVFIASRLRRTSKPLAALLTLAAAVAVLLPLLAALNLARTIRSDPDVVLAGALASGDEEQTAHRLAEARIDPEMSCAASFVAAHSSSGEPIFSATTRHDKLFVNNVAFYFAAGRTPATHWYHFDPGLQTRADVQQEIIGDLVAADVRWVVRQASWDAAKEPNESALSSGVGLLDNFIEQRFRPVARFGDFSVWLAKDEAYARRPFACSPAAS